MATIIDKTTTEKVEAGPETVSDAELVRGHLAFLDTELVTVRQHLQAFGEAVVACDGVVQFGSCLAAEIRRREQPEAETEQEATA